MEKLFGIDKVLVIIYENLIFADQLRLAQVHLSLRSIFESYIFSINYYKLKIRKLCELRKFLVSNVNDEDCMLLEHNEIENLLKLYADNLEQLHVTGSYRNILKPTVCEMSWSNLRNLTCLHYEYILISDKHLLVIAENCPQLKELQLRWCRNKRVKGEPLTVEEIVSISTLEQMKNLKILIIYGGLSIGMTLFCELITKVHLECLKLHAFLWQDDVHIVRNGGGRTYQHRVKELEIAVSFKSLAFLRSTGIFKNLIKLYLKTLGIVRDCDLEIITKECRNLECLTFGENTNFNHTMHFPIPGHLKELYLFGSRGLKHTHVVDAVSKLNIEKFKCKFYGDGHFLEDVSISSHLKELDLENINTFQFSFYSNINTLRELHWYDYEQNNPDKTQNWEFLTTCRNLENLIVHSGFIPIDVILKLNQLQNLKFVAIIIDEQITWSYVIDLLKHTSLKELDIQFVELYQLKDPINNPFQGFPSTIIIINIKLAVLENAMEFWLNMLQQNRKMSIRCDIPYRLYDNRLLDFLKKLIQHKNLPKDLREIKIFGFNINCKELRENFMLTIKPVREMRQYEWDKINEALVLSRLHKQILK